MVDSKVVVRPAATAWGAVLGGWIATIGASVILAPVVAGLITVAAPSTNGSTLVPAVPFVLGILISYLIGGYVAGRMAGYRTSWHGMMTAFFSLFILLIVLLVGGLADRGVFAASGVRSLADVIPGIREFNADSVSMAVPFGAILGFLAAIFGGWLGGLLAPSHVVAVVAPAAAPAVAPVDRTVPVREVERERAVVEDRPRGTLQPAYGRKGGERVEDIADQPRPLMDDRD
jgi:hypothetical protein